VEDAINAYNERTAIINSFAEKHKMNVNEARRILKDNHYNASIFEWLFILFSIKLQMSKLSLWFAHADFKQVELALLAHHLSSIEWVVFELIVIFALEDLHIDVILEHNCASEVYWLLPAHHKYLSLFLH
jgi:hypothetical protein